MRWYASTAATLVDSGTPVALDEESPLRAVFDDIADTVVTSIAPVTAMDGCSARLLERVEAAVDAEEV